MKAVISSIWQTYIGAADARTRNEQGWRPRWIKADKWCVGMWDTNSRTKLIAKVDPPIIARPLQAKNHPT